MTMELIFVLFIFIICIEIYVKLKDKKDSFALMVSTALITTIIGNLVLPSDFSLYNVFNNENDITSQSDLNISEKNSESEAADNNLTENSNLNKLYDQLERESSGNGGSWVILSLRKKELDEKIAEHEKDSLDHMLDELNSEIENLNQEIEAEIKNSDIKLE